jgi:lipoate-protein ligase A
MHCRIFPYQEADGPANMALDEALLETVADDPAQVVLRTYGWTEPTLSLGYFQAMARVGADPRWEGVPVVRRATGGGAIWHHHELTYALALPGGHPLGRPAVALYHAVHSALAALLRAHGIEAALCGHTEPAPRQQRPLLCFADRSPSDVVCQGAKLVGSAQRRRGGVILQHGSMLLRRSPVVRELAGVGDLAAISADPRYWSVLVGAKLAEALGLAAETVQLPVLLAGRARALEAAVYRNDAWNQRR